MNFFSTFRIIILSRIAWLFVLSIGYAVRVRFVNKEFIDDFFTRKNVLYAFFHGDLVLLLHSYRNSGLVIPVSESRDGEIMARLLKIFGFDVVRGSSRRKGQRALLQLITRVRDGKTVAISVDGPRGPLRKVKPGIVYLAAVSQIPVIPVAVCAKRSYLVKKSWDALMIPAPFTECTVLYGEPVYVKGTSETEIKNGQEQLEKALNDLKYRQSPIMTEEKLNRVALD